MPSNKQANLDSLLETWEEVYKRGLFSFWLLLALREARSYAYELPEVVEQLSLGTISVNGNSVYRSLRKFEDLGLVRSELEPSGDGPDRRYYELTEQGLELLREFIRRNIAVFNADSVRNSIRRALKSKPSEKLELEAEAA